MYCKIFHLRSFKITTVNWVRYRSVCCYGQQSKCATGSIYNSFRQYLIVVDRIWIFKQLCENFKDPQHVFSGIFFFGEFPKISLQIVPLTQEKNFFVLQVQLYEDFAKSQVKKGLEETVSHIDEENKNEKASKDNPHVFQVSIDFILTAIQRLFYSFNCEFDHGH